jgi:hypothetical protein
MPLPIVIDPQLHAADNDGIIDSAPKTGAAGVRIWHSSDNGSPVGQPASGGYT